MRQRIPLRAPAGAAREGDFTSIQRSAVGTFAVAHAVAESEAISVVGGGDSVAAVNRAGVAEGISHISTGGGLGPEARRIDRLRVAQRYDEGIHPGFPMWNAASLLRLAQNCPTSKAHVFCGRIRVDTMEL